MAPLQPPQDMEMLNLYLCSDMVYEWVDERGWIGDGGEDCGRKMG